MKRPRVHALCVAAALSVLSFSKTAGAPAFAQGIGMTRPSALQTWRDQQAAQAWATRKLDQSPRRHEWVTLSRAGRTLRAFVTYPQTAGRAPVVLVLHEVFGLTDSTRNTADEIAAMGYIAITPDMLSGYGPYGGGTSSFGTTDKAGAAMTALPNATVNGDLDAWSAFGLNLPQANSKLAIVGLSWGGGAAFRYAATPAHNPNLKAVFVFYDVGPPAATQGPARDTPISVAPIDVPVYGFYASTDARVAASLQSTKDAMTAAGKIYDPLVYEGANHGYMRVGEDPASRTPADAAAVKASLARLRALLLAM